MIAFVYMIILENRIIIKMGCQSSIFNHHERDSLLIRNTSQLYNINFCDFVKGNIGTIYEEYHFSGWIYRNSHTIVRRALHKRSQVQRVVKIIKRNITTERKTMHEINVLKKLDNPSIVKLHEYFIDNEYIYLIFEQVDGKHIYDKIVGVQEFIIKNLQSILKQILIGIQHCHSKGIVHYNLIPENILIVSIESEIYVKIIGFGDAVDLTEEKENQRFEDKEIEEIMIEKIFKKKISQTYRSPQESKVSNIVKQDIWSIGVILENIMSKIFNRSNFLQCEEEKIQYFISQKSNNPELSRKLVSLLRKMLEKDPSKRLTAGQCLKQEYFKVTLKNSPWKITIIYRSLHNFQIHQKLKAFLSMYITFKETNIQEQHQFLTEFYNLDTNKDGCLQYEEVLEGLKNYYQIPESQAKIYVNQIFKRLDKNGNGCIEYSEFLLGTVNLAKIVERKSIHSLFREIDKNGDGYIDGNELKDMLGSCGIKLPEKQTKISIEKFESLIQNMVTYKKP